MKCDMDCLNCQYSDCINDDDDESIRKAEYKRTWRAVNPDKYAREKRQNAEHVKKRYYERKAAGICTMCGKVKVTVGTRCDACRKKGVIAMMRYRERLRCLE